MPFADEPVEFHARSLQCGWSERAQAPPDNAARAQQFARRLGVIDPAYERIRPDPGMRTYRPGDLGPIVDMETAALADLIDRRGRFDPPRYPAPVSPTGYRLLYRSDHKRHNPSSLSVSIRAGEYGPGWVENRVDVRPDVEHALWRDPKLGVRVFNAMVAVWAPEWACAFAHVTELLPPEGNEVRSRNRPWLAWTAKPLQPRPVPPFNRP